ncbi:MAG: tyrosine-type recombinase/integrase [Gemmatimonadaceae bacterium]
MPLTDTSVRSSKKREKPTKLHDERGLYLLVNLAGKYWRFDYRFAGKRKTLALGVYPDVSLAMARERRDEARRQLAQDIDPGMARRIFRTVNLERTANSFDAVAREWHQRFSKNWTEGTAAGIIRRLEIDLFPWVGGRPIAEIRPPELLAVLRRVESRGALETAHRIHQYSGQIFRYAVATGRAERDPAADLRGALPPVRANHHASITEPKAVGQLLRAISGYAGSFVVKCALRLAPLVFVRPGELRHAQWAELNLDSLEWRIPAERMKMRAPHVVPLSTQSVNILRDLHQVTGNGQYVFPGTRSNKRPMSENTVNAALRRLDYRSDQMTGHGFRSMASTLLNEAGWHRDAIERQLAHAERDAVRAAYNYAEHLPERRRMMQAWADYLSSLENGAAVIPMRRLA